METVVNSCYSHDSFPDTVLEECARLFSSSYGIWGKSAPSKLVGKRVKMTTERLRRELLFDSSCFAIVASVDKRQIGQAFCRRFQCENLSGSVVWITQLVVHPEFRRRKVATNMITNALSQPSDVAAGLVSSNPFSVRSLEKAVGKRVEPELVKKHAAEIIRASKVPYMQACEIRGFTLDTKFFVDHTKVNQALDQEDDWKLGSLGEGEEFIAIAFLPQAKP